MSGIATFLHAWYGKVAAVLGAIGVLWAGYKTIREVIKHAHETSASRRERREAPNRMLAMIQEIRSEQERTDAAQQEQLSNIKETMDGFNARFDTVDGKLNGLDSQVGTMQNEKLTWAYVYYGVEHHPIPLATLTSLEQMYDQYVSAGKHNHVPQDFKERIRSAYIRGAKPGGNEPKGDADK